MGTPLFGVVDFHSETGTEGGYWAFQDKRYIHGALECLRCHWRWKVNEQPPYPGRPYDPVTHQLGIAPHANVCKADEHETEYIEDGSWDYEGLHLLATGDHLVIYSSKAQSRILWEGDIKLIQYALFTQTAHGMWIHADQEGVDRETWADWFMHHPPLPARLELADRSSEESK